MLVPSFKRTGYTSGPPQAAYCAIRNAIANYSEPGDKVLTASWHWAPYKSISNELYRGIERYEMFDENGKFHLLHKFTYEQFKEKL